MQGGITAVGYPGGSVMRGICEGGVLWSWYHRGIFYTSEKILIKEELLLKSNKVVDVGRMCFCVRRRHTKEPTSYQRCCSCLFLPD